MAWTTAGSRSGMGGYELHDQLSEQFFRPTGGYFANFSSSVGSISEQIYSQQAVYFYTSNPKYFPKGGRGITWYNFMSDQFSGFHAIVVPGTLRDSIYALEGLSEQQTGLRPTEIMTDMAGASDLVFGLFWLLGYQFSLRLAYAGEARFWRVDQDANYGPLNELARNCMNTRRAEHHWEDMLRIAGSLKLGTIQASELIRSLLKSERPSSLALAIMEVGRINKTVYLLN